MDAQKFLSDDGLKQYSFQFKLMDGNGQIFPEKGRRLILNIEQCRLPWVCF